MQLRADIIHQPFIADNDDTIIPGAWTTRKNVPCSRENSLTLNSSSSHCQSSLQAFLSSASLSWSL